MATSDIEAGDTVRVDIKNDAPIGGDTQMATFTVEETHIDRIVGTDETWGDECVISDVGTDTPQYRDGGKSGEVVDFGKVN